MRKEDVRCRNGSLTGFVALQYNPPSAWHKSCAMALQTGAILRPLAVMMNRHIQSIRPNATLSETAGVMRNSRVGALLVESEGAYVGIVSESDLVRKAMAMGLDPDQTPVRSLMSSPLITIEIDRSAHEASDLMSEKGIRHLVITQDSQIVGIISVRDLLRYFKNWGTL
ncbi:MAG TPA: CBS domain-containing protein [Nitrospiraceae bacterium]|nr:CBS domain-containing protein [Nitrospiraceae bacterium]